LSAPRPRGVIAGSNNTRMDKTFWSHADSGRSCIEDYKPRSHIHYVF
jgi:hypothetical protein